MHEMSLCQNMMEIIEQQQKKHDIHEVTDIWLEIGALSCVEQSAVEFCCPHCHSACLQRRSGTEFRVKEIAVK